MDKISNSLKIFVNNACRPVAGPNKSLRPLLKKNEYFCDCVVLIHFLHDSTYCSILLCNCVTLVLFEICKCNFICFLSLQAEFSKLLRTEPQGLAREAYGLRKPRVQTKDLRDFEKFIVALTWTKKQIFSINTSGALSTTAKQM